MKKDIIVENYIDPCDWESKSNYIIEQLNNTVFAGINEITSKHIITTKSGATYESQKRVNKDDIMPMITSMQVTSRLNRLLRIYRPMTLTEALELDDTEYLKAFGYYCDIISHINTFLVYVPDKQTFSAFVNITTDTYNELMTNIHYSQVFSSIEDSFIQSNYTASQTGLVDNKTTISKLQTKNAGHNLVQNEDNSVTVNIAQQLDVNAIEEKLKAWKLNSPSTTALNKPKK